MILRCPTTYVITGTKSFRRGSRKILNEFGANLQNPGKDIIEVYRAPEGRVITQADQSGAEALIVANDTTPGNYMALFDNGIKPHTFLALHIFYKKRPDWFEGLPLSAASYIDAAPADLAKLDGWKELNRRISKNHDSATEYYIGKRTAHGRAYRLGVKTYVLTLMRDSDGAVSITNDDGKYFFAIYDALFPEVLEWQDWTEQTARDNRVLFNKFGHPRECNQRFTHDYIRDLISWVPQSTVGVLTQMALTATQQHIEKNQLDWDICSDKHDSLATETAAADAFEAGRFLRDRIREHKFLGRNGRTYSMNSTVMSGARWTDDLEKWPDGLVELKFHENN